jgi:hypothetical protein
MAYWLIQHTLESYDDRPDAIGMPRSRAERDRNFRRIMRGDKLVYYAVRRNRAAGNRTNLSLGLFEITSEQWLSFKRWGPQRTQPHLAYAIKPIYPHIGELKLSEFGIMTTRGRTAIPLTPEQYKNMQQRILGMGEPTDHESTVALFAKLHPAMGFPRLLRVRQEYPDIIAVDSSGKETRIELEFQSHTFESEHGGQPDLCDLIVCWEDTWGRAAKKPVLSMKEIIYQNSLSPYRRYSGPHHYNRNTEFRSATMSKFGGWGG